MLLRNVCSELAQIQDLCQIYRCAFSKNRLSAAMGTNQNQRFCKIHEVGRCLLKERFRNTFVKISAITQN